MEEDAVSVSADEVNRSAADMDVEPSLAGTDSTSVLSPSVTDVKNESWQPSLSGDNLQRSADAALLSEALDANKSKKRIRKAVPLGRSLLGLVCHLNIISQRPHHVSG